MSATRSRKTSVSSKRDFVNNVPVHAFPYPQLSEYNTPMSNSPDMGNSRTMSPSDSVYSFSTLTGSGRATPSHNSAEDGDSIRVIIRTRPMNALERQRQETQVVFCLDDEQTIQVQKQIDGQPVKPMTFHHIFDETTTQELLFETSGIKNLVERAVEGYNITVFAYGQTGTGKTFTITGPDDVSYSPQDIDRWGLVPRCLKHIFFALSEADARFTIYSSYLEIYNEQVHDLLNPVNTSLPVRWHSEKGFYVENLFVVECEVLDDCMAVLEEGIRNRRVASHRLNEHSSRSHGIMTVTIEVESLDPDDGRIIRKKGKITFVDLAGSEKIKESKATGETLTETLNINKSLLTLGNCISALADMKKKKNPNIHVPYRDSKLTKLLSDSLGGNGMALMFACVSPANLNVNETLNTLRYASRAKRIQNRPVIQMDPREELIMKLKQELKTVKAENEQLRNSVIELSMGKGDVGKNAPVLAAVGYSPSAASMEATVSNQILQENKILQLENQELKLEKETIKAEKNELLKENERLINKMERLVHVFGSGGGSQRDDGDFSADTSPMPKSRLHPESAKSTPTTSRHHPKIVDVSKRGIDRSVMNISNDSQSSTTSSTKSPGITNPYADAPVTKNKAAMRKELSALDKEIDSLSVAPEKRKKNGPGAAK